MGSKVRQRFGVHRHARFTKGTPKEGQRDIKAQQEWTRKPRRPCTAITCTWLFRVLIVHRIEVRDAKGTLTGMAVQAYDWMVHDLSLLCCFLRKACDTLYALFELCCIRAYACCTDTRAIRRAVLLRTQAFASMFITQSYASAVTISSCLF